MEIAVKIGILESKVENIEQNLANCQKTEACALDKLNEKYDKIIFWIMGLMGTSVVSLALLVANLISKKG